MHAKFELSNFQKLLLIVEKVSVGIKKCYFTHSILVDEPKIDENVRIEPVIPNPPKEEKVENSEKDKKSEVKQDDLKIDKNKSKEDSKDREAKLKAKEEKAEKLIEVLEKQKEEHQQIIEEQKEVLDKMKQHLEADEEVKKKDEDIIGQNQVPQQQVPFSDFRAGVYRTRLLNKYQL